MGQVPSRPVAPDFLDVIHSWIEYYLAELHTAFPGRVESFDASTQKANIRPLIRDPEQQASGSFRYADIPVLPAVTVVQPRTHGWGLSLPVNIGDTVLVVCQQLSPGMFESGDGDDATHPGDTRRHSPAHAVALVGYFPVRKALQHAAPAPGTWPTTPGAPTQPHELGAGGPSPTPPGIVLGAQDTDGPRLAICQDPTTRDSYAAITVNGAALVRVSVVGGVARVELGEGATDFVALASEVNARLNTLREAINTVASEASVLAPPSCAAPLASVAATTVKAT